MGQIWQNNIISKCSNNCVVLFFVLHRMVTDVAVISLNRAPTNFLNRKLLHELTVVIDDIENDSSYRGIILTSVSQYLVVT